MKRSTPKEKIFHDLTLGDILVKESPRASHISIKIKRDASVVVTVPTGVPFEKGLSFLASKKDWVKKHVEETRKKIHTVTRGDSAEETIKQIENMVQTAGDTLPAKLMELAGKYSFHPKKIVLKANRTKWGSCNIAGEITLNINLVSLPGYLQDYVMLHELCHTRFLDHGEGFHALLNKLCRDELMERRSRYEAKIGEVKDNVSAVCEKVRGGGAENLSEDEKKIYDFLLEVTDFNTLVDEIRKSGSSQPYRHVFEKRMKKYLPF